MAAVVQKFSRYDIIKPLGQGAMGQVFLAHDPVLDRNIALKIIPTDPLCSLASREAYVQKFITEAKASARLIHPSIVAVYDAGCEDLTPWIAFQCVEGETLESILEERRRLTLRRALLFTMDIASALGHAHSWNIIHRDVKPANILIDHKAGIAKLADFGIAQVPGALPILEESTLGSMGYMSPEQIDGKELDGRSDLFSLGVVLYRMLCGEHPFLRATVVATVNATIKGEFKPVRECASDIPLAVERVVRRCLFPDRRARISSAAELMGELEPLIPPDPGALGLNIYMSTGRAAALMRTQDKANPQDAGKLTSWYDSAIAGIQGSVAWLIHKKTIMSEALGREVIAVPGSWAQRITRMFRYHAS